MRTADVPLLALSVRLQDERALPCADEYTHLAHSPGPPAVVLPVMRTVFRSPRRAMLPFTRACLSPETKGVRVLGAVRFRRFISRSSLSRKSVRGSNHLRATRRESRRRRPEALRGQRAAAEAADEGRAARELGRHAEPHAALAPRISLSLGEGTPQHRPNPAAARRRLSVTRSVVALTLVAQLLAACSGGAPSSASPTAPAATSLTAPAAISPTASPAPR